MSPLRQYWVAPIPPLHIADGSAYTGTAAIGDISPAPAIVIPANTLEIGSRLEFNVFGRYSSAATPGTAILGIYIAPTATAIGSAATIAAISAVTLPASQTNRTWRVEGNASVRAHGTSGTIIGCIEVTNLSGTSPNGDTQLGPFSAPATATVDTTQAQSVRIAVTPSVTTQSWTTHYFGVRLVN